MRIVYFVIGPESSGTRLTTRILCESGCFGDFEHYQRLDEFVNNNVDDLDKITTSPLIVFRRSVPHGEVDPNVKEIVNKFEAFDCTPVFIVPIRNLYELCKSKVNNNHKETMQEAFDAVQREIQFISHSVLNLGLSYYCFNTSFLFKEPEVALYNFSKFIKLEISVNNVLTFLYDADKNHIIGE